MTMHHHDDAKDINGVQVCITQRSGTSVATVWTLLALTLLCNTNEVSRQKLRPLRNLLRKQEFLISVTFSQKRD